MDRRIHLYIDGDMSVAERQAFEKELREDRELSRDYAGVVQVLLLARALRDGGDGAPQHITDAVMQRIEGEGRSRPFPRHLLKIAAAVVFALLAGAGTSVYLHRNAGLVPVTFSISAPNARAVYLLGTFNDWGGRTEQLRRVDHGIFTTTVRMRPGIYQYVFRTGSGTILQDPHAGMYADDGFGQRNALIIVKGTDHS